MSNQVVGAPCIPLSCPYIGMDGPAAERASQVLLPPPLSPALARQKPHREFLQPRRWKGRNPPGARTARLTGSTPGVVRPASVRGLSRRISSLSLPADQEGGGPHVERPQDFRVVSLWSASWLCFNSFGTWPGKVRLHLCECLQGKSYLARACLVPVVRLLNRRVEERNAFGVRRRPQQTRTGGKRIRE